MLPKLVNYFYDVENAFATDGDASSFGFEENIVSVEEIMVRLFPI